jgi:hypothetical protein
MTYVNGFLFGAGMITAAIVIKLVLHVGVCG